MGIAYPKAYLLNIPKKHFNMTANKPVKEVTKILIVEDEGDMSLLLELLLDGEHMHLEHVHTLNDARKFVEKEQPTLILLDNRLPDGYGIDFVSYLKSQYPLIKVIMISGVDAAAADAALATGADFFLRKPFTRQQLHASIEKVLTGSPQHA
jgi:two-component system, OmpR family, response regulator